MSRQEIIDPCVTYQMQTLRETRDVRTVVPKTFVNLRVSGHISIVVLRPIQPVVGDIQRDRVVPRLGDAVSIILQGLMKTSGRYFIVESGTNLQAAFFFRTIIDTSGDNVPPGVHISNVTPPQWTRSG